MAAVAVSLITDPPGRLLGGVAGVSLLVFAIFSWRARPKLAIKNDALVSRGWFGTKVLPRTEIKLIRITEFRRLARKVRLLEIDTNSGDLIVFTRWDLGTDPLHVLDALTQAGYAGPGSS
ncbi:protein of unknown function [Mycolicibacterium novocastrense]|uniref:Low molecular weight protein antigen 6 PH domain-containing protein n=1 Tax=Mycolicibacterium novocastrense TaxID=59813 RepID=A0ABQ0KH79_MYCNV|nr:protein of unknown function [Mycolicibacterium novocastrense]